MMQCRISKLFGCFDPFLIPQTVLKTLSTEVAGAVALAVRAGAVAAARDGAVDLAGASWGETPAVMVNKPFMQEIWYQNH